MATIERVIARFTGPLDADGNVKDAAKPYLIELGQLLLAWNDMHEKLGELYWIVTGISNGKIPLDKWHGLRSDREQRKLLREALVNDLQKRADAKGKDGQEWLKRIKENTTWLLDTVDTLAEDRNNFVHSPFLFSVAEDGTLTMQPLGFWGNKRAQELTGKDLLDEMARLRENIAALGTYSLAIEYDILDKGAPTRPVM